MPVVLVSFHTNDSSDLSAQPFPPIPWRYAANALACGRCTRTAVSSTDYYAWTLSSYLTRLFAWFEGSQVLHVQVAFRDSPKKYTVYSVSGETGEVFQEKGRKFTADNYEHYRLNVSHGEAREMRRTADRLCGERWNEFGMWHMYFCPPRSSREGFICVSLALTILQSGGYFAELDIDNTRLAALRAYVRHQLPQITIEPMTEASDIRLK